MRVRWLKTKKKRYEKTIWPTKKQTNWHKQNNRPLEGWGVGGVIRLKNKTYYGNTCGGRAASTGFPLSLPITCEYTLARIYPFYSDIHICQSDVEFPISKNNPWKQFFIVDCSGNKQKYSPKISCWACAVGGLQCVKFLNDFKLVKFSSKFRHFLPHQLICIEADMCQ